MGAVTTASGCVDALAVCASAWTPGAISASAVMQDASTLQRQARLVAGTKRIAIPDSTFTSPILRSVDYCWRIAVHYQTSFHVPFRGPYYVRLTGRTSDESTSEARAGDTRALASTAICNFISPQASRRDIERTSAASSSRHGTLCRS